MVAPTDLAPIGEVAGGDPTGAPATPAVTSSDVKGAVRADPPAEADPAAPTGGDATPIPRPTASLSGQPPEDSADAVDLDRPAGTGAGEAAAAPAAGSRQLLAQLVVESEHGTGYDRDDWPHWRDLDGDRCHTRCEVLAAERRPDGSWYSIFDGRTTADPSGFDVDHLVPLAEAHESGGWRWDRQTRERYANDESYPHALIAVSATSNRSKGKKDPAEWLPPDVASHCFYADAWVRVKFRWKLSADPREKNVLDQILADCPAAPGDPPERAPAATATPTSESAPIPSQQTDDRPVVAHCDARGELVRIEGPPGSDLDGWRISDEGEKFSHTFGPGTLIPASAVLVVASGSADGDVKPWGARNVWNNDGDTATLSNPTGESNSQRCS